MISVTRTARATILTHCVRAYPEEACGMLLGTNDSILVAAPARNDARSARVFTVSPQDLLRAEELASSLSLDIVGVFHSHTHSEPYPSPTDVRLAPEPSWLYGVVSLKRPLLEMRIFRIDQNGITEVAADLIEDVTGPHLGNRG